MKRSADEVEREKFEQYLFEMDDVLEDFVGEAGALGYRLDYGVASLEILEPFILERLGSDPAHIRNRAARYLGEVFRKNIGGRWDLYLDNPRDLHYKLPVITGFSTSDFDFCPIEVIENFVVKRERGLIKQAFDYTAEYADKVRRAR